MSKQTTLLPQSKGRMSNGELYRRTFTVRAKELQAVALFASTDETRFVLNGVRIEVSTGKAPVMIATDGRRLAAIESCADQGEQPAEVDFDLILASAFIKPLCAFAKSQALEIQFEYRPTDRVIATFIGGRCVVDCEQGAVIQGTYPDWRKCLPTGKKSMVPHIGVNAEFMADFAKAAKLLDVDTPIISVNLVGKLEAMEVKIQCRPQFYGVLMPAKVDEDQEWQPEFLDLIGYVQPVKEEEPTESKEVAA